MEVAIVTGGVRGIGKAISICLHEKGCKVYSLFNHSVEMAKTLEEKFPNLRTIQLDIKNSEDTKKVIKNIYSTEGHIDYLVNNAGVIKDGYFLMMSEDKWNSVFETNLKGTFNVSKVVLKYMKLKKKGSIVNLASTSGITGQSGQANYSASKGAIISLTKTLSKEFVNDNIRINSVSPGFIETEMLRLLPDKEKLKNEIIPMKRFGKPHEVANVVEFLLSDKASYITGKNISIDGGMIND